MGTQATRDSFFTRRIRLPTQAEAELISRWETCREILHLHRVFKSEEDYHSFALSPDQIRDDFRHRERGFFFWLLYIHEQPVGFLSAAIDPEHLFRKREGTLWPGIVIGEQRARGRGVGRLAMEHCERFARRRRCSRIELGVFAHNERALRLYRRLGYREIGRIEGFTWWDGRMQSDIRMEKLL
jgi:ribosomal protein S18 acetylase RimI-like enzyme